MDELFYGLLLLGAFLAALLLFAAVVLGVCLMVAIWLIALPFRLIGFIVQLRRRHAKPRRG